MNFVEDVLESFPAARLGDDRDRGGRRAPRVGLRRAGRARAPGSPGALAARGVGRGDVVMTLIGNRPEWVLAMLACFRIGAVALPCNTQLRRADLEHRVAVADPAIALGEDGACSSELPERRPVHEPRRRSHAILDEERPQAPPAVPADLDPADPALIVFTSGTTGAARAARPRAALPAGQRLQAEHWFGRPARRARLVHRRERLVEVGPQRLRRALARPAPPPTCARAASSPPSGSRSASARGSTSSARRRPSTGCSRSGPSCGRCRRCAGSSPPASRSTPR